MRTNSIWGRIETLSLKQQAQLRAYLQHYQSIQKFS